MNAIRRWLISRRVMRDLQRGFPGLRGSFWIDADGEWHWRIDPRGRQEFYDLYPRMSRERADEQIIRDIMAIIRRHVPGANLLDYDQHGVYHEVKR